MPFTDMRRAALALAVTLVTSAACTVKNTEPPPLAGPSQLALTLNVLAIPDSINQDGGSQSSIRVTAIGPDGKPLANVPLRVDMAVSGVPQDYGKLSARSLMTNADGVASVVYTAPPSPPNGVFGTCNSLPGNCVEIVATPSGTNFVAANPQQVEIRLVPTGVILPPASTPTAQFTYSPTPVTLNTPVTFDASTSCGGPLNGTSCTTSSAITSYAWSFGDGTTGSGRTISHTFSGSGTSFNVTLTVTNDRGVSSTSTQAVTVAVSAAPAGDWVYSPSAPTVNETVLFNADAVKAAPGHTLVQVSWNFGDPNAATTGTNAASGSQASHVFSSSGSYTVVLTAVDETGQKAVLPKTVIIGSGNPAAVLLVSKTGGLTVQADASGSSSQSGTIVSGYTFNFGDGTASVTGTSSVVSHTYASGNTYVVRVTVSDNLGRTGTTTASITVP